MKSIIIISVFFGKFPWYMDLFLKSCEYNQDVDFLIFTNNSQPPTTPQNVHFSSFDISKFNRLASEKLGFEIQISRAYKLCDFKPAYGIIFEDYIVDFDFWGICDIDLIFGKIRNFFNDELLGRYQVFSVRHDYTTGFFMLFQNTPVINTLFTKSKDYKMVLTSPHDYCFDECNYQFEFIYSPQNILNLKPEIESMLEVIVKADLKGEIKAYFDFIVIEGTPGKLFWKNGLLSYKDTYEILLYHFVSFKSNIFSRIPNFKKIPNTLYITKHVILSGNKPYLHPYVVIFDNIRPIAFNFSMKIRRIFSRIFNMNKSGVLPVGTYGLGDKKLEIGFDKKLKGNFIVSKSGKRVRFYECIFNRQFFFIENSSSIFKHNLNSKKITEFFEIKKDGNTGKFSYLPNIEL